MSARLIPTAHFAELVFGPGGVAADDPAETYHEASRLYESLGARQVPGVALLERHPELLETVARAGKRYAGRPRVALEAPDLPEATLGAALAARRSRPDATRTPLPLADLGTLLAAAYGVTGLAGHQTLRASPSGGALYPLELYVVALDVIGLPAGVHHYDPSRHALVRLRGDEAVEPFRRSFVRPELVDTAAAVVVFAAMFWRSRFKYGQRGYRFVLIEAGHAAQNLLLAATAAQLAAVPVGGFYDRPLDSSIGVDSVDEAAVYAVAVGGRA